MKGSMDSVDQMEDRPTCTTVSSVLTVFSSNSLPPALAESNICDFHRTSGKERPPLRTNMDRLDR